MPSEIVRRWLQLLLCLLLVAGADDDYDDGRRRRRWYACCFCVPFALLEIVGCNVCVCVSPVAAVRPETRAHGMAEMLMMEHVEQANLCCVCRFVYTLSDDAKLYTVTAPTPFAETIWGIFFIISIHLRRRRWRWQIRLFRTWTYSYLHTSVLYRSESCRRHMN